METDQGLLERWAQQQDADAFQTLVNRYGGMVYAVCKRILGNSTEAEDAAQECFAAMAGARPVPYLGAWLHRVATNQALSIQRSESRRTRRERQYVADVEPSGEPGWDEICKFVDEAIAGLPEKLRAPLVAHFFQDQTYDAIGASLGVSRQAAAYRVSKGIEHIRRSLRRKGAYVAVAALAGFLKANAVDVVPERLAIRLAKLALAGPRLSGTATIAAPSLFGAKGLSFGGVALLVALLGAWFIVPALSHRSDTVPVQPQAQPAQRPEEAPASPSLKSAVSSGPSVPTASVAEVPKGAARRTTGIVYDPDGAPVEDAVVWAVSYDDGPIDSRETRTDARGEFALELESGDWSVKARKDVLAGTASDAYGTVKVSRGADPPASVIRLAECGTLRGRVLDKDTLQPIPHAAIWLDEGVLVTADAAGSYEFKGMPKSNHYLYAVVPGYERRTVLFDTSLRKEARLDLRIRPGGMVRGVVTDTAGKPIPNALVSEPTSGHTIALKARCVRCDAEGRFERDGVGFDVRRDFEAAAPGFKEERTEACVTPEQPVAEITFVLQRDVEKGFIGMLAPVAEAVAKLDAAASATPGAAPASEAENTRDIKGVVLSPEDQPVADAKVRWGATMYEKIDREVRTDSAGHFLLPRVPGGECYLTVSAPGFAPAFPNVPDGKGGNAVEVRLAKGLHASGVVHDSAGQPLKDVAIIPVLASPDLRLCNPLWLDAWKAKTDTEGHFELKDLPPNTRFDILGAQLSELRDQTLHCDGVPNEITLNATGAIRGRVVDPAGRPVRDFRILIHIPKDRKPEDKVGGFFAGFESIGISFSSDDGEFVVSDLVAGHVHRVIAVADGFGDAIAEPVVATPLNRLPPADQLILALTQSREASVRAVRNDSSQTPIPNAHVIFLAADRGANQRFIWGYNDRAWVRDLHERTDASGWSHFADIGAPTGVFVVQAPGCGRQRIAWSADQAEFTATLDAECVVTGTISDATGRCAGKCTVRLSIASDDKSDEFQYALKPADGGCFRFDQLPPGEAVLQVVGFPQLYEERFTLTAGETHEVNAEAGSPGKE